MAWRPRSARPGVISSAYSRSDPTGRPLARRVTATAGARSRIASARPSASSSETLRMWKASRWAVRCPIPGRRASSVMSRLTGAANNALHARQAEASQSAKVAEAARGCVHLAGGQLLGGADPLVHRCLDHVLQHFDVVGVDRAGVDRQLPQLQLAADLHGDHPAARARLHDLVLELLLSLGHVGLHLLDLLHHLIHVRLTHQSFSSSKTSSALNSARSRSMSCSWSSVSGPAAGAIVSLSSKWSESGRPMMPRTAVATRSRPCSAFFLTNAASAGKAIVRRSPSRAVGVAADRAALSIPFSSATASATAGHRVTICSSSTAPTGWGDSSTLGATAAETAPFGAGRPCGTG